MRIQRPWSTKHWCESVENPEWPFAYSKYAGQVEEIKGRTSTNLQDMRHTCTAPGVESKCHICEDIVCEGVDNICSYQIQGVSTSEMSVNIPTVSDVPWAVNGAHRYDFNNSDTSHVCMFLAGGDCTSALKTDYSGCPLRCWGHGLNSVIAQWHLEGAGYTPGEDYDGAKTVPWMDPVPTDVWSYPKSLNGELPRNPSTNPPYSYNPQGFVFTMAGSTDGASGFVNGPPSDARFNNPEGIATDAEGYIYVADSGNHAIRMIAPDGNVVTIAGLGTSGSSDGDSTVATFSSPAAVAVWYDWRWWSEPSPIDPDSVIWTNGGGNITLFVADTGNHRIRKITGSIRYDSNNRKVWQNVNVTCFSGRCGEESSSYTPSVSAATPQPGYADGQPWESRFNSPRGLSVTDYGDVVVADTNNHLVRILQRNGTAHTLAGSIEIAEVDSDGNVVPGCLPPCLKGVEGTRDGDLVTAQFSYPTDVAVSNNITGKHAVFVTDSHLLRKIAFEVDSFEAASKSIDVVSDLHSIKSSARVVTLAGQDGEGERDGSGPESQFNSPEALIVTNDGIAYVADSTSCRIRRVTPASLLSVNPTCEATCDSLTRSSGCASYDPPVNEVDLKVTPAQGYIYNNHKYRDEFETEFGIDYVGRTVKDCVGSPPVDRLDKKWWNDTVKLYPYNYNLVIDDYKVDTREDPEDGITIKVFCSASCDGVKGTLQVEGGPYYSGESSVCGAAIHSGSITATIGGWVTVTLERGINSRIGSNVSPTTSNGITTQAIVTAHTQRLFTIQTYNESTVEVQTISGAPSGLLEDGCGYHDSMPPQEALFSNPHGIAASRNNSLNSDTNLLFISDRNNHAIRGMSATCSFVCENMGACTGPDICQCAPGWEGIDCTVPVCSTACGNREVCVAPATCACIPGYSGPTCDAALCVQTCEHGGSCAFPDTCDCQPGWFDSNCTTPVCTQTCGNGGNCTGPDACSCPSDWTGHDCRIPFCSQTCENGGFCTAPDSCTCPAQWSGHDCSLPVCHQGYFIANGGTSRENSIARPTFWTEYKPCNLTKWCNDTSGFDCKQTLREVFKRDPLFGEHHRHKSGRKEATYYEGENGGCVFLELGEDIVSPYPYLITESNKPTDTFRYTPNNPYDYLSDIRQPHNAFINATDKQTQPWKFTKDRQVALVEWLNTTQGVYVCANDGNCTAPDVCVCSPGWSGFDCRTPICEQGYYKEEQETFLRGTNLATELTTFSMFLGNNTYRLDPSYITGKTGDPIFFDEGGRGYSNPNYTHWVEEFANKTFMLRFPVENYGARYKSQGGSGTNQGGYSCSIRSVTEWENEDFLFEHPNYYSRFMDTKAEEDDLTYTDWVDMEWAPTYQKSKKLEWGGGEIEDEGSTHGTTGSLDDVNIGVNVKTLNKDGGYVWYVYTDQGYRRDGDWTRTGAMWMKGTCIIEFDRTCPDDSSKAFDLEAGSSEFDGGLNIFDHMLYVQDTDLSFRPRIRYDDKKAYPLGEWFQEGGECVDEVVRGCYNNGVCVAPNTCRCAEGWTGYDCTTPICDQTCHHNGYCTLPNTCTCEKGWEGHDCRIAVCAQECNNYGSCVAPDTCQCMQWPNTFYDGREGGGRPRFRKPNGDPQMTGWTGYDCSTPICVQHNGFLANVDAEEDVELLKELGGHGKDGKMVCTNVRCLQYDELVTTNDGKSFQTGCGYDPLLTGCCDMYENNNDYKYICHKCKSSSSKLEEHTFVCENNDIESWQFKLVSEVGDEYKRGDPAMPMLCGRNHNPGGPFGANDEYFASPFSGVGPEFSSQNGLSNSTSDQFLCKKQNWTQGDFIDDAGLGETLGLGSDFYGLEYGRHVRINYPNYILSDEKDEEGNVVWGIGDLVRGEGVYECSNSGSCIGPDYCTCMDGWTGYDCKEPICRHMQSFKVGNQVSGCLNGGICSNKDNCYCIQTVSVLWMKHKGADRGLTGWSGTDCSMPVCVQGYYDPFCFIDNSPGGEGCFRCANGGSCVAPDFCECAPGWTGFDCRTPLCEVVSDVVIRKQLKTLDEEKVHEFEIDPCSMKNFYPAVEIDGSLYNRGNCTQPNACTCYCQTSFNIHMCSNNGVLCGGPWQDNILSQIRNVLEPNEMFGTRSCVSGYEGIVDENDYFLSCHLSIVEPMMTVRYSFNIGVIGSIVAVVGSGLYVYIRRRLKRRYILAKIERRKSRRSSEDSITNADGNAFTAY